MSKVIGLAVFILWTCCLWGQTPNVYLIKAGACSQSRPDRYLSGFRVLDKRGIYTALHGVVGCKNLTATDRSGKPFVDLFIAEADIDNDVAVLSSRQGLEGNAEGLRPAQKHDWHPFARVLVFGHPFGLSEHGDTLNLRSPPIRTLLEELPPNVRTKLEARGSPSTKLKILSLAGPLKPGHSGAPIVDMSGNLVAVANGGLRGDSYGDGTGWAILYDSIKLMPAIGNKRLADLEKTDPDSLFAIATIEESPLIFKMETEKQLRYIIEATGPSEWTQPLENEVTWYAERRTLKGFDSCQLSLLIEWQSQEDLERRIQPYRKPLSGKMECAVDFGQVCIQQRTCCGQSEQQQSRSERLSKDPACDPLEIKHDYLGYYPRDKEIITIATPGFTRLIECKVTITTERATESQNIKNMDGLNLYYESPAALSGALGILNSISKKCH